MTNKLKSPPRSEAIISKARWKNLHTKEPNATSLGLNFSDNYELLFTYYSPKLATPRGHIQAKYELIHKALGLGDIVHTGETVDTMDILAAREWAMDNLSDTLNAAIKSLKTIDTALRANDGFAEATCHDPIPD